MNYQSKEAGRSRTAYLFQCAFEYFTVLLVSDSILSVLLSSQGFSDSAIGVISSLTSLAFIFQLVSVPVIHRVMNVKRFSILFHISSQLFFGALFVIPFLPFAKEIRRPLMILSMLLANFGSYFVRSLLYRWGNSFVEPKKLGLFSANKEMISLLTGTIVQFAVGYVMDRFTAADNTEGSFIFCAVGILIFTLCNLGCLMTMSGEVAPEEYHKTPTKVILQETLGQKGFRATLIQLTLWQIAHYSTLGFIGVYKTNDLMMSMTVIQVINVVCALLRFAVSRPMGRYSDKHSFAQGTRMGLGIAVIGFVFLLLTTPDTWWMIIPYQICYTVSLAGTNANFFNITYQYTDSRYYTEATSIKYSIAGVIGFLVSILAGAVLNAIQQNGNQFLGIPMRGQQFLSVISILFTLATVLYTRFVLEKLPRINAQTSQSEEKKQEKQL